MKARRTCAILAAAILLGILPASGQPLSDPGRLRGLSVTIGERNSVVVEIVATRPISAKLVDKTGTAVSFSIWPLLLDRPLVYPVNRAGVVEVRLTQTGPTRVLATVEVTREVYVEVTAHPAERVAVGLFPVPPEGPLALALPTGPGIPVLPEALPVPGSTLEIKEGQAKLLSTPGIVRVAVGSPKVADVVTVNDRELLLNAMSPGETNLFLWLRGRAPVSYIVKVLPAKPDEKDVLLEALRAMAPDGVKLAYAGKALVVSGFVDTQVEKEKLLAAAKGAMKDRGEVVDLLEVRSPIQVQLGVRIAEVNLMALKDVGLEWGMFWPPQEQQQGGGQQITVPTTTAPQGPPPTFPMLFLFSTKGGIFPIQSGEVFFRLLALAQQGKANILATPNLVTMAGKEAKLVVGGQVPVPTGQGIVEFKPFGVVLNATPEVDSSGRITLKLEISNSELDFTRTVQVQGSTLPTIIDRRVNTQVSLLPGETLGIGGLISHITQEQLNKIPILGDLPILGALFRSRNFQERKTEVVFFITPQIVGKEGGN